MSKSIQLRNKDNEKMYPHPYYPIGSIYLSVNNTNPSKWFDGTWKQIAKGRTLVGVDTEDTDFNIVKKIGGEKTHTLTVDEIPAHTHSIPNGDGQRNSDTGSDWQKQGWTVNTYGKDTGSVGGGQAHNNLQPYFTCYIWLRTA